MMMMLKAIRTLYLLIMLSIWCSKAAWELPYSRKAIPTEAGESICSLSRKLKDLAPWTARKVAELKEIRDDFVSKLLDWKLHFYGSFGCEVNESILDNIRTVLENVNEDLQKLPAQAIRAGALAAKSAGRLDEFITVFANARERKFSDVNYCLGGGGSPVRRRNLFDCFSEGGKTGIGESNLAKIPETVTENREPDLAASIETINHSALAVHMKEGGVDDAHADCNMINGKKGVLGEALQGPLWWGGGILTIGKCFDGEIKKDKFASGETRSAKSGEDKAFWTASPHTIPHLNKTLAAFQAFKDTAAKITQKFSEIENIEKQIEPCLSNETMEEVHTQSCFKSAVRMNADLQAANALLARYHKEKGPLPSASALILHQSVVNVWCLILAAFLL